MREITVDGKQVRVMGCPMALLYYKQEFASDLVKDFGRMNGIDALTLMQITWAMAKAAAEKPKDFPSFEAWAAALESFDTTDDKNLMDPLAEEIGKGFFRQRYEAAAKERTTKQKRG